MASQTPHQIVDRKALGQHLARAAASRTGENQDHPLVSRVTEDITGRLSTILRSFERAVVLSPLPSNLATSLSTHERIGSVCDARLFNPLVNAQDIGNSSLFGPVVTDDEQLPFQQAGLDLLISTFALQAANDLPGALLQACQALRPDGLFIGVLLAGQTLGELRQAMLLAETECAGGVSPRVLPFADIRALGGLMQRAGFTLPVADIDTVTMTYRTPLHLMQELRSLGATNIAFGRTKKGMRRDTMLRAAEIYAEKFSKPDGRILATVELVTVTGWSPHDSQPQPLKPGSAEVSLAEVLPHRQVKPPI